MSAYFHYFFVLLLLSTLALGQELDPVSYRFSFVGCNRVGFEVDRTLNPSTANVQQLLNTFREIAQAEPKPRHLFFLGDLILGYTSGLSTVDQLQAWKSLYARSALPGSGVELVPVVGNHEVLLSYQNPDTKKWRDFPNPPAALAWKEVMRPLLKWRDGPTLAAPNSDALSMPQDDLSFTVRDKDVLFVILNTDTFVDNVTTGDIPLHWLGRALQAGQEDPEVKHIFVMGHKPLIKPDLEAWIIRDEEIQPALDLLSSHSKVRAYLTSHFHLWDYRVMPGGVPQIIAGNGGSPLKGPFLEPGVGYYGYTLVDILESGKIVVESWGRPVPEPYDSDLPQGEATLRQGLVLPSR